MCIDPHALAQIQVRESLDSLELILTEIAATDSGLSSVGLKELTRLRHRLDWCTECYSRRRSQLLLMWIVKNVAELVMRIIMRPSFCSLLAKSVFLYARYTKQAISQRKNNDIRIDDQIATPSSRINSERICRRTSNYPLLSIAARNGQERANYPFAA